jgi:hypothetical protein
MPTPPEVPLKKGTIGVDLTGQVVSLSFKGEVLSTLPESISVFTNLKLLNLANTELKDLPESIGEFSLLEWLDLSDNQLTSLPSSIGKLKKLQELYLSHNQFSSLPTSFRQLTNLQTLSLTGNSFLTFPNSLLRLRKLRRLALDDNELKSLPSSISQLTSLREIELWNNQLSSLPSAFKRLKNLESLILAKNHFPLIPRVLGDLKKLQSLDLTENLPLHACARVYSGSALQEMLSTLKTIPLKLQLHELVAGISIVQRMKDYGFTHVTFTQSYQYYEKICEDWSLEKHDKETFYQHLKPYQQNKFLLEKQEGDYLRFYLPEIPDLSVSSLLENLLLQLRHQLSEFSSSHT